MNAFEYSYEQLEKLVQEYHSHWNCAWRYAGALEIGLDQIGALEDNTFKYLEFKEKVLFWTENRRETYPEMIYRIASQHKEKLFKL